jgi:hypothetical protein
VFFGFVFWIVGKGLRECLCVVIVGVCEREGRALRERKGPKMTVPPMSVTKSL